MDDFHGTRVADPYRWLEEPSSSETRAWVAAQRALTDGVLSALPGRQAIQERLTRLWNYERFGIPSQEGGRYFFYKNDGLQNQAVLYVADSLSAPPRVLLDPNALSADGTVALADIAVSPDGRLLAYAISHAGSDWMEWKVRDVDAGRDLSDRIQWTKFTSVSWTRDSGGFYYSRYDEPDPGNPLEGVNYYNKLYHHRLGAPQSADTLVLENPSEKEWSFGGHVTEDGRYLVVSVSRSTEEKYLLLYQDLVHGGPMQTLIGQFEADYTYVANDGPVFYLKTTDGAPRGRVIAIDLGKPDRASWREVVPEAPGAETLTRVSVVGDTLFASYLADARSVVRRYSLRGQALGEVRLPGIGTAGGFDGTRSGTETFYSFSGFTAPTTIYRYDLATGASTVYRRPQVDFDPSQYETRQVFYPSKDGTRVPMFISHKKGIRLDGSHPTYLYGYGGFNVSLTPAFSVSRLVWMEMGGILAVPNLRGGGEYGEAWHEAGMRDRKQNVFDDFIAAAEYLIRERYTSTPKLAIAGGSNGGLLVGACMTQRPELFGAALPAVGVLDMLRYHRFTIGHAWMGEYGDPSVPGDFAFLHAYSPLHNVRAGVQYPPTLILTGDHDDRVVPAHSYKFAAALQAAQAGDSPALIRIEQSAGHGAGKPVAKQIEEIVDTWAFLKHALRF